MTPVVVDASFALALALQDEASADAELLFRSARAGRVRLEAPAHWPLEVLAGLQQAARRRRLPADDRLPAFDAILTLGVEVVPVTLSWPSLLALADDEGLRVYDAVYLALALQRAARIATGDEALRAAARRRGIEWEKGQAKPRISS
jgi:predicted nucleic acid-binding protein